MLKLQFNKLLIANRGEIACRIIRTAQSLGYQTVAVFSAADVTAPHTKLADSAICIGPAPAHKSYLAPEKIIAAALQSGAQAIHPGYGFLSENAAFVRACSASGLQVVGPSAAAIELMGNKAAAKRHMAAVGVPCVPGYHGLAQADDALLREAQLIGFPLMVKAAAGGGGRGMRLVNDCDELPSALAMARSEALNSCGSEELILEKALLSPRHVEVQVFADSAGNTVHLGERDCSIQRRHQKVIEEAPCPVLDSELRSKMGTTAVAAATSIDYVGAGTVEFLLDHDGSFYFLEMNTRLQVEHPVTEMITGRDLVALQLQVAQGEPLGFTQDDVVFSGHAIEVRLYSEDPAQDFLPTTGQVDLWQPAKGEGIRVDDGIVSGQAITPYYDPLLAKIIAWGADRADARRRLVRALRNSALLGVSNNKAFLIECLENATFIAGTATTSFIESELTGTTRSCRAPTIVECAMAAVLDTQLATAKLVAQTIDVAEPLLNWSSTGGLVTQRCYEFGEQTYDLSISKFGRSFKVRCAHQEIVIETLSITENRAVLEVDSDRYHLAYVATGNGEIDIAFPDYAASFLDLQRSSRAPEMVMDSGRVIAPMHGTVLELMVTPGQAINKGDSLITLEAMKMQHAISAASSGVVSEVLVAAGAQVAADELLVIITASC